MTHNEQYEQLQKQYLESGQNAESRDSDLLGKMYLVIREIQTNYLNDYCKKKGISFSYDDFEDKLEDATLFIINQYLKKPDFKVNKLSAYQYFGRTKQLFKNKEREMRECRLEDWKFNEI